MKINSPHAHVRFVRAGFVLTTLLAALAFGRPVAAAGVGNSPVVDLSAGDNHTCAVSESGLVRCWGDNSFGQLGNPDYDATNHPVDVPMPGDARIVQVAAGAFHTCALSNDARVFCWGSNGYGELGLGSYVSQLTPQLVTLAPTTATPVRIAAGGFTTCVAMSNGTAQCWGRNQYGEVGDGTRTMRNVPTAVTGIADAVDIDAGVNHTCVVRATGRMQCWGRNIDGRAGDMTFPNVALLSAGGTHTCVRTTVGGLHCWGGNAYGQLTPNNIDGGIARVATGANHTCAATEAGTVVCWGASTAGQLGDTVDPVPGDNIVDVTAGANHTCVLTDRGAVLCWGDSTFGQAGDHSLTTSAAAVELIAAVQLPASQLPVTPSPVTTVPAPIASDPSSPATDPVPIAEKPADESPAVVVPAPIVTQPAVVDEPVAPVVEKQAVPAPAASPVAPATAVHIPRLRTVSVRVGSLLPVTRVAHMSGVRVPSALIVGSINPSRSVSNHAWSGVKVEMSLANVKVCRNVLTPSLTAALRVAKAGVCSVKIRVAREGKSPIVRTVVVRSVVPVVTPQPGRGPRAGAL